MKANFERLTMLLLSVTTPIRFALLSNTTKVRIARFRFSHVLATGNGVCEDAHMRAIFEQLDDARIFGTNIGSLVTGQSRRPTEHVKINRPYKLPSWWNEFWASYGSLYPQFPSADRYGAEVNLLLLLLIL